MEQEDVRIEIGYSPVRGAGSLIESHDVKSYEMRHLTQTKKRISRIDAYRKRAIHPSPDFFSQLRDTARHGHSANS